jgi:heme oxygenase
MLLSHAHLDSTPTRVRPLTRIDDETRARHADADAQRLSLTLQPATAARYRRFLLRLYGFEAPVEAALHTTPGIADLFDVRARLHTRLLRADLASLGIVDLTHAPRSRSTPPFSDVLEALGWIYVIERGRMLSSMLLRHIEQTMPALAATTTSYLRAERSAGTRMRELAATFDSVVRSDAEVDRVLAAAHGAFRAQSHWYSDAEQPRMRKLDS